jgi:hypothetical protein
LCSKPALPRHTDIEGLHSGRQPSTTNAPRAHDQRRCGNANGAGDSGSRLVLGRAGPDPKVGRRDQDARGYTGGDVPNATCHNHGSHAEAIKITFDPTITSYRTLREFFFQIYDPTTQRRRHQLSVGKLPKAMR